MESFDKDRPEFKPYGLRCIEWQPSLMPRPDRHNEVEINYFPEGDLVFLIKGHRIEIKGNQFLIFWALIPHQILEVRNNSTYYVCTIPFREFIQWNISMKLKDCILNEYVILTSSKHQPETEIMYFKTWIKDLSGIDKEAEKCSILEIQAKLSRLLIENDQLDNVNIRKQNYSETNLIEKIALFIAKNYTNPLTVSDIGKEIGISPDYANMVFKKAFNVTIKQYLTEQRITHAQRLLSSTNKKIIEIAYESGFNSISRFNASFKLVCKCTPKDFKAQL